MTTPKTFVPELLSPAGSLKNMRYAFAYGADAVYAGLVTACAYVTMSSTTKTYKSALMKPTHWVKNSMWCVTFSRTTLS